MKQHFQNSYEYEESSTVIDAVPLRLQKPVYIHSAMAYLEETEITPRPIFQDQIETLSATLFKYILPTMIGIGIGVSSILVGAFLVIVILKSGVI